VLPRGRPLLAWLHQHLAGPAHPVARAVVEGDEVGGFTVLETPAIRRATWPSGGSATGC
jgi:hypothetical protein